MIPQGGSIRNEPIQERQQPSLTWKVDLDKGKVVGMIDGLEAIKQTVFFILQTERFRYLIYSFDYGHELNQLVGRNPSYVESELNRLINEALTQDDRIDSVDILSVNMRGDSALVRIRVNANVGTFEQEVEVDVRNSNV